jgi:hypothetical protein
MSGHYEVWIPFAGHVSVIIKAKSESAAIDAALKAPLLFSVKSEVVSPEIRNLVTLGSSKATLFVTARPLDTLKRR